MPRTPKGLIMLGAIMLTLVVLTAFYPNPKDMEYVRENLGGVLFLVGFPTIILLAGLVLRWKGVKRFI